MSELKVTMGELLGERAAEIAATPAPSHGHIVVPSVHGNLDRIMLAAPTADEIAATKMKASTLELKAKLDEAFGQLASNRDELLALLQ